VAHTFEELKGKTVAELREIAATIQDDAVKGYSQLNKEHLLTAICKALHLDTHTQHVAALADKTAIKQQIKALKKTRDAALAAKDVKKLMLSRRKIRHLKRKLRQSLK
jgi:hypothetical protein